MQVVQQLTTSVAQCTRDNNFTDYRYKP